MRRSILTLPVWAAADTHISHAVPHPARDITTLLVHTHVMDPAFDAEIETAPGSTLIAWSGRADDADPDPFAPDPKSWLPSAMPAFLARLDALEPALRRHRVRVLIRPHARHIVSDVPRAVAVLNHQSKSTEPHFGIALEPAAMLEPSMLPTALDHIRRILESLAHRSAVVILTNVREPIAPDMWFTPCAAADGLIPPVELVSAGARLIPADCPIAILADDAVTLAPERPDGAP